jgi:hypothetical protein
MTAIRPNPWEAAVQAGMWISSSSVVEKQRYKEKYLIKLIIYHMWITRWVGVDNFFE